MENLNRLNALFWMIICLSFALVAWSILFEIETSINAEGEITPLGKTIKLQNRFESKVLEVLVKEGEKVSAGQELVYFETEIDMSDSKTIQAQIDNLIVRIDRLNKQLKRDTAFRRKPEYDKVIFDEQTSLLINEINDLNSNLLTLAAENELKVSNRQAYKAEIESLEKEVLIARSQLKLARNLFSKGYEGEISLMEKESKLLQTLNLVNENNSKIDITNKEIQLIDTKIKSVISEFSKTTLQVLVESKEELRSLLVQKKAADARIREFNIDAPLTGTISSQKISGSGQVLKPGEIVMEIIPDNKPLVFYAKVSVQYIDDISLGQKTLVTPSTADTRSQKPILGYIHEIAPDTTTVEGEAPHYEVMIKFADNALKTGSHKLKAGVTGNCSIITGSRTVLEYFLDPIFLALRGAMSET
ncbi:HlyD family type I secretion periplasmic adaptor subunit [Alphaproteobacteria bacterium]|nr:HlyD family type I secretion periplasmic adaptor subunit [Alphaproteobacteria bacterium]